MHNHAATATPMESAIADVNARIMPALGAALLGAVLIFASGFATTAGFTETNLLHNAAHDARHSAGFPCH